MKIQNKIGIVGGTFNPIHLGHLLLAEAARETFNLDRVLFIPSGNSYMKDAKQILDGNNRLHLVELAVRGNPFFEVSAMEIERMGETYTCDTLKILKQKYPETEFYFIVGADSLFHMQKWKNPEIIFQSCHVAAAVRDNMDLSAVKQKAQELQKQYHASVFPVSLGQIDISSTMIRDRIRQHRSIRYMVPASVLQYIEEKHFYQSEQA